MKKSLVIASASRVYLNSNGKPALWHERGISHSSTERVIFPDTICLDYMFGLMTKVIDGMTVNEDQMTKHCQIIQRIFHNNCY